MNILYVDDDVNVLESLQIGINYETLEIDKVYVAETAMEAKEILTSVPINIMITDIEMPQESGIELLTWTKEHNMNIVTIFCTCYADFNYAMKAVELQCFDYYLKPIAITDFEQIIKKAVDKVKQDSKNQEYYQYGEYWIDNQKNRKENFWEFVLLNIYDLDKELLEATIKQRKLEYQIEDSFDLFLLSIQISEGPFSSLSKTMSEFVVKNIVEEIYQENKILIESVVKYEENAYIIVTKNEDNNTNITQTLEILIRDFETQLKCKISIFYDTKCTLQMMRSVFEQLVDIWNENINNQVKYIKAADYQKKELSYSFTPTSNWEIYLDSGLIQKIMEEIRAYLGERKKKNMLYTSEIKFLQVDFLQMVNSSLRKNNIDAHELFICHEYEVYRDNSLKTYDDYIQFCEYTLEKAYGYISFVNKSNSTVDTIKQYIEEHYSEEITRSDLANIVYLNSDYMARVFKKEEGISISDYVIKVRIEKAKELLIYSEKTINEISIDIGYDNFSYFSRLFKKMTSYAPKEYRKMKKGENK